MSQALVAILITRSAPGGLRIPCLHGAIHTVVSLLSTACPLIHDILHVTLCFFIKILNCAVQLSFN